MRRATNFLLRNWPLKLGALLLATVLYAGFVVSLNVRVWTGSLPVEQVRPPLDATLLSELAPVTTIRYRAPLDVFVTPAMFAASADLSDIKAERGGPPVLVPVTVTSLDSRVQVIGYEPDVVQVHLDPVETRRIQIDVVTGSVPGGLSLSTPQIEPASVDVRGASSRVTAISAIVARVSIDGSALNVDREVDLLAIDAQGNPVPGVEIEPARARVRIAVARQLATRTLPVVPQLTGTLGAGLRLAAVDVRPLSVTVSGEESVVSQLQSALTDPIDLTGRTRDFELDIPLALPDGVTVDGASVAHITVTLAEELGSRTFQVGVSPTGGEATRSYALATSQVAVTLAGPLARLDALGPGEVLATVDVAGLEAGTHSLAIEVALPDGLELVVTAPSEVSVSVSEPSGAHAHRPLAL